MTSNIESLNLTEKRPKMGELLGRIDDLILEYDNEVGFLEVIGMLDYLKTVIISRQEDNILD